MTRNRKTSTQQHSSAAAVKRKPEDQHRAVVAVKQTVSDPLACLKSATTGKQQLIFFFIRQDALSCTTASAAVLLTIIVRLIVVWLNLVFQYHCFCTYLQRCERRGGLPRLLVFPATHMLRFAMLLLRLYSCSTVFLGAVGAPLTFFDICPQHCSVVLIIRYLVLRIFFYPSGSVVVCLEVKTENRKLKLVFGVFEREVCPSKVCSCVRRKYKKHGGTKKVRRKVSGTTTSSTRQRQFSVWALSAVVHILQTHHFTWMSSPHSVLIRQTLLKEITGYSRGYQLCVEVPCVHSTPLQFMVVQLYQ